MQEFKDKRMNDVLGGGSPTLLPVPGVDSLIKRMNALRGG